MICIKSDIVLAKRRSNRKRNRLTARQRQRRDKRDEKNFLADIAEGKAFIKNWEPLNPIMHPYRPITNKSKSIYQEGGKVFKSGRALWLRPCSALFDYWVIGDSQVYK